MSSLGSESSWSFVEHHREQEMETARNKQAMIYEQAQMASSAANLTAARRLGTSRTHYQIEDPMRHPPPPLVANVPVSAPAATTSFASKRSAPKEFPRTVEEKVEREPRKLSPGDRWSVTHDRCSQRQFIREKSQDIVTWREKSFFVFEQIRRKGEGEAR